jgi:hypothetical protein
MEIMAHKKFPVDPRIWGPGTHFCIHMMGMNIKTVEEIPFFIKTVRMLTGHLPCSTCRGHAATFLSKNPPEQYIGNDISKCFKYTVDLHNHANTMTGKGIMSYEDAFEIYTNLMNINSITTMEAEHNCSVNPIGCFDVPQIKSDTAIREMKPEDVPEITLISDIQNVNAAPVIKIIRNTPKILKIIKTRQNSKPKMVRDNVVIDDS